MRDRLSNWAIHALYLAERKDEIIPLCEDEAKSTGSYVRLVKQLISAKQYTDAERWIHEGIQATEKKWPGIASSLREKLREIRVNKKDWPGRHAHRPAKSLAKSYRRTRDFDIKKRMS